MDAIIPTLEQSPASPAMKDESSALWGCMVAPFAEFGDERGPEVIGPEHTIHRCAECFGYLSPLCEVRPRWWRCGLCGHPNQINASTYSSRITGESCELVNACYEYVVPLDSHAAALGDAGGSAPVDGSPGGAARAARKRLGRSFEAPVSACPPLYLAVVDESADSLALEAVCDALDALVAAAPPGARFGLITYSDRLGLYDLGGAAYTASSSSNGSSSSSSSNNMNTSTAVFPSVSYLPLGRLVLPTPEEEARGVQPSLDYEGSDNEDDDELSGGGASGGGSSSSGGRGEVLGIADVLEIDELTTPLDDDAGVRTVKASLRSLPDEASRRAAERDAPCSCFGLAVARIAELLLGSPDDGHVSGNRRLKCAGVKLMCFVASPCSHGPGAVLEAPTTTATGSSAVGQQSTPVVAAPGSFTGQVALANYSRWGTRCGLGGVSVDLLAVGTAALPPLGLSLMAPLARFSGGCVRLHPHLGTSAAAQRLSKDCAKVARRPTAWRGCLRVRTSRDAVVSAEETYGTGVLDPSLGGSSAAPGEVLVHLAGACVASSTSSTRRVQTLVLRLPLGLCCCELISFLIYPSLFFSLNAYSVAFLFMLAACDPEQTIALGFSFGAASAEAAGGLHRGTVVQAAFAYTTLVEDDEADNGSSSRNTGNSSSSGDLNKPPQARTKKYYTVRRLRIINMGIPRASSCAQVLGSLQLDATLMLLAHKAAHEAAPRGLTLGPCSEDLAGAAVALASLSLSNFSSSSSDSSSSSGGGQNSESGEDQEVAGPWSEARVLLQDWLVRLAVAAAEAPPGGQGGRDRHGRLGRRNDDDDDDDVYDDYGGGGGAVRMASGGFLSAEQVRSGGVDIESVLGRRLGLLAPFVHALAYSPLLAARISSSSKRGKSTPKAAADSLSFERRAEDAFVTAESTLCHQSPAEFRKTCYPDLITV